MSRTTRDSSGPVGPSTTGRWNAAWRTHAALDREAIETGDRIDVDEMRRPRHAERHHRDEALTAGEDAAVLRTEFSEVRQRVIDRLRRVVDERRRFHRAR